jgi:hypothetical protein
MTTKTIPAYLEDERRKHGDDQLRIEKEAARIQPLHHGHHRTAKEPKLELPAPVEGATKIRKTRIRKTSARKTAAASRKKPVARKTATKGRKAA